MTVRDPSQRIRTFPPQISIRISKSFLPSITFVIEVNNLRMVSGPEIDICKSGSETV